MMKSAFKAVVGIVAVFGLLTMTGCRPAANEGGAQGASGLIDTTDCPSAATTPIDGDSIRVGITGALSGPYAIAGEALYAFEAVIDEVNESGGVDTVDGKKTIDLIIEDDEYTASISQQKIRSMVQSGSVDIIAGQVGSAPSAASARFLNENCVPQVWNSSFADNGVSADLPFSTQLGTNSAKGEAAAELIKEKYPNAKVAFIYVNNDIGISIRDGLRRGLKGSKVEIVETQTAEQTDTTVNSQVTTLRASDADVLVLGINHVHCTQALTSIALSAWRPHVVVPGTCVDSTIRAAPKVDLIAKDGGIVFLNESKPLHSDDEDVQKFRRLMTKHDAPATDAALIGYRGALLTIKTLEEATVLTPTGIAEAASTLQVDTLPTIVDGIRMEARPGRALIADQSAQNWDVETDRYVDGPITRVGD